MVAQLLRSLSYSLILATATTTGAVAQELAADRSPSNARIDSERIYNNEQTLVAMIGDTKGDARRKAGDDESAKSSKTSTNDPDKKKRLIRAKRCFDRGINFKSANDSSRALLEFLKASKENPRYVQAYYEQALIFREKNFKKLAISRLEQALAIEPTFEKGRVLLATLKLEEGDISSAVVQLGKTLGLPGKETKKSETEPNHGPSWLQRDKTSEKVTDSEASTFDSLENAAPPMILQSLHTLLPNNKARPKNTDREDPLSASLALRGLENSRKISGNSSKSTLSDQDSKKAERKAPRRSARRKVRKNLERKYKKYRKFSSASNIKRGFSHWLARVIPWAGTFSGARKRQEHELAMSLEKDDLKPKSSEKENIPKKALENNKGSWQDWDAPLASSALKEKEKEADSFSYIDNQEDGYLLPSVLVSEKEEERSVEPSKVSITKSNRAERAFELPKPASSPSRKSMLAYTPGNKPRATKSNTKEKLSESTTQTHAVTVNSVEILDDDWTHRLKDLAENGTGSLKSGEAFMFSEDTGEAVIFLADGKRVRRYVAQPKGTNKMMELRRPDALVPDELTYDTSLLGKIIQGQLDSGKNGQNKISAGHSKPITPPSLRAREAPKPPPSFQVEELTDGSASVMNWLRSLMRL